MYSKINASCEHSCSLCAAKHAGIITHCIQCMVYFPYNPMLNTGKYTIHGSYGCWNHRSHPSFFQSLLVSRCLCRCLFQGGQNHWLRPSLCHHLVLGQQGKEIVLWRLGDFHPAKQQIKDQSFADWSYVSASFLFLFSIIHDLRLMISILFRKLIQTILR